MSQAHDDVILRKYKIPKKNNKKNMKLSHIEEPFHLLILIALFKLG